MAEFNSYLLGKASKSVGNVTLFYMKKKNIARAKIFKRKDTVTPEILTQRAKLGILSQEGRRMLPVVRKGFVGVGKGSPSNAFVQLNMDAVEVDGDYNATINYPQLRVASGIQITPKVAATYSDVDSQYSFTVESQEEEEGFALTDDKVYAVLYESVLKRTRLVDLGTRGAPIELSYPLPEDWDAANVHLYAFATTANGRVASDSIYLAVG